MQKEAGRIDQIDAQARSAYEKALMRLTRNLFAYNQLKHAIALPRKENLETEFQLFLEKVTAALAAADDKEATPATSNSMRGMMVMAVFGNIITSWS